MNKVELLDDRETEAPVSIVPTRRLWSAISYLSFLCLIPLFAKRDDEFILGHARQGLLLFVGGLFLLVMSALPFLGVMLWQLGETIIFVLSLLGIFYAARGESWTMPLLGESARDLSV
ncbi:MAG: hypothetical protein COB53_10765 [Elusimicrobia bacterium]|nr:MAG: hypothetical protein COB53_10765 [Elusimicrobiota bacterium]